MRRSPIDWGGNIAAYVLVIVANTLSNALPINGQTIAEISNRYPSLFTPSGFTFSIWGAIYLALLVFVVFQALPSQRDNASIAKISHPFQVSCVANATWIIVWHYNLLFVSLAVMLCLLISLVVIYRTTIRERMVLQVPFSLYTAWITVATIANVSVIQTAMQWDNIAISAEYWTLLKLAGAGAIGTVVSMRHRDFIFISVVAWAAYGISVKQIATPSIAGAATMLAWLAGILAMREIGARLLENGRGERI